MWEQSMRYELPKSYSGRATVSNRHITPMPLPEEAQNRSPYPNQPGYTSQLETMTPERLASAPEPPLQRLPKNVVPAAYYTKLLAEYESCTRQNKQLRQTLEQLLGDISNMQAKYEQVVAEAVASRPSPPLIRPPSSSFYANKMDGQLHQRQPRPALEAISPAPQDNNRNLTNFNKADLNKLLPRLSFLNRLRQSGQKSAPSPQQYAPQQDAYQLDGVNSLSDFQGVQPSPTNFSSQQAVAQDIECDSPYMRAREEQAQNGSPLWIWLVAWLLLLPVSAGLGYTFVQWMVNADAPTPTPTVIQEAE